jgi:hypothetical protein
VTLPVKTKFDPQFPINGGGPPSQTFRDYLSKLDLLVAAIAAGNLPTPLVNAVNDAGPPPAASRSGSNTGTVHRLWCGSSKQG